MDAKTYTSIGISPETKERLRLRKINKTESFESVIVWLMNRDDERKTVVIKEAMSSMVCVECGRIATKGSVMLDFVFDATKSAVSRRIFEDIDKLPPCGYTQVETCSEECYEKHKKGLPCEHSPCMNFEQLKRRYLK